MIGALQEWHLVVRKSSLISGVVRSWGTLNGPRGLWRDPRANDIACKVARARVDRFHTRGVFALGVQSIGGKGGLGCVVVGMISR